MLHIKYSRGYPNPNQKSKSVNSIMILSLSFRHSNRIHYYHRTGIRYINSLCSLDNLSKYIGSLYLNCPNSYHLNDEDVVNIQNSIISGTYRLSPLTIYILPYIPVKLSTEFIMNCAAFPNKSMVFTPSESDKIVLTALGFVLNDIFDSMGYYSVSMSIHDFYNDVLLERSDVAIDSLYRIDLSSSLLTLNQDELIKDLESILGKNAILDLVLSFLHVEYKVIQYEGISFERLSIPPSCFIANALLNYEIHKLDYAMSETFNTLKYDRYMHEIYISISNSSDNNDFEREILSLLDDLNLSGKIFHIKRGIKAHCFVGHVGLDQNGQIVVQYD